MSDRVKGIIGEELYNQVIAAGLKPNEFDLIDKHIPKARFDEINNKFKAAEEKNKTYEKQIAETTGIVSANEDLKSQLETLNQKYLSDIQAKDKDILNATKSALARERLSAKGAKGKALDMLMREINLDELSVENNNLLGFDPVEERLQKDCGFMFPETQQKSNNDPQEKQPGDTDNAFDFMKNL